MTPSELLTALAPQVRDLRHDLIVAQSGHKSETVMRGYVQDAGVGAKRATRGAFGENRKHHE